MKRLALLLLGLWLMPSAPAAAAPPKAGNYELSYTAAPGVELGLVVLKIEVKDDGTLAGTVVDAGRSRDGVTVQSVALDGDVLRMALKSGESEPSFEGRVPKAGATEVPGSYGDERRLQVARLTATDKDKA